MNKHESKYFQTALLMDEAFVLLLEKKDFEYITIKEVCEKAGVNRSTFYLHYENMNDLLSEVIERQITNFLDKYPGYEEFKIDESSLDDLRFYSKNYVVPYLEYIKENRKVLCLLKLIKTYLK